MGHIQKEGGGGRTLGTSEDSAFSLTADCLGKSAGSDSFPRRNSSACVEMERCRAEDRAFLVQRNCISGTDENSQKAKEKGRFFPNFCDCYPAGDRVGIGAREIPSVFQPFFGWPVLSYESILKPESPERSPSTTNSIARLSLQTPNSDNDLMLSVRDGHLRDLGELFERYHERLYNFFVRHTRRPEASEDLVQDVFLRMLKYRHTFRGDAPFTVWMYQLARNASADHFRKWRLESPMNESAEEYRDTDPTPVEASETSEEHEMISRALGALSEEKREVLVLSRFQGLKYEEIGRILQCPVGTVKARVHFALKDLRDEYERLTKERVR